MATRRTSLSAIKIIEGHRFAFNQGPVYAGAYRRLAKALNGIQATRGKCFMAYSRPFGNSISGNGSGTTRLNNFRVRTSPQTTQLRFIMGIIPILEDIDTMTNPRARVRVLEPDEALDDSQLTGAAGVPTDVDINEVSSISFANVSIDVSPETEYIGWLEVIDDQRVISIAGYEHTDGTIDDALNGGIDPTVYVDEGPILTAHFEDLVHANNTLPDAMGANLIHWSHGSGTSNSKSFVSTGGYVNLADESSTSVTGVTPGYIVDLTNCGDVNGDVKCRFAVRADNPAAGGSFPGNGVRIVDQTDGELAELVSFPASGDVDETTDWGWKTTDITLEAKEYKIDIQAKETEGSGLEVYCAQLYPHPHT